MKRNILKLISVVLVVILSLSLFACGAKKPEPTEPPIRTDLPPIANGYYGVGETMNIGGILYTVLSATKSYGKGSQERAAAGSIFICIEFEVENCTTFGFGLGSIGLFTTCDNSFIKSQDTMAKRVFGDRTMPDYLERGQKKVGTACYKVPEDFKEFVIDFAVLTLSSVNAGVKLKAEDFVLVEL